ncbi:GATA zinc finger domain-containing protein 14-like [Schistocerca serialis cubense]|uniref:GATA zinc finger domain-containing protein 14-like n=1 Tax=Schistocerca serialis cubense TaxID=2023355 RepID=UPI00214E9F6E|nr:GATA zinc finger domain-containing protein 14-like [Schistocerca serialis cubense]
MERGKVEIVSADELSEVDSSFNQQESPRFPPWTSSQINAMILLQTRNICDNTQMATLNDEMWNGREARPSAPLLTSMSEPNMRPIQQCDTNRTQETDKLDRLLELFADMKRDLSQRFETLSDRVTKQEETLVTFTHETKNNITRCENQLTQIVNVQQEVNTRVEELAQAHTSASSTQEKLTEEVGNITQQLTMVVLEQTHLKEKIEKLEDRADLASLNNDTNMAERIVHEFYRGDSRHSNFIHISNQNQHPPQRNRSDGGWWNHPPARETYSNGNVYDSRNNRRNSWNNNNNYHPYQNGNYKQNENYRQYNNNNRRRENNRYNPGYFDRNMTYNRRNYHQNNTNPNNHRQNMWNTQNSRMANHNPPRKPPPFPGTVMHSPPQSSNNNCGAPSADAWAPTGRNVNIVELVNEPGQTQQTTENSRRPS